MLVTTLAVSCAREPRAVRLATTTSVDNSGLLEAILPAFQAESGVVVDVVAVGSGKALQLVRRGDADLALTHDPDAEALLLADGRVALYRKVMFNDFLIVGPPDDAASVRGAAGVGQAMRRIARSSSAFVSRGDESGTHARERMLWTLAGMTPARERILDTGQGMAATLRIASERHGYCLTDRATFVQLEPTLQLAPIFEGGAELLNTYAVLVGGRPSPRREAGLRLARWLAEGRGRGLIETFDVGGVHPFTPWPAERPSDTPRALPR